jgi:hypothetical protein
MLRPQPAVVKPKGRLAYVVLLVGMFLDAFHGIDTLAGTVVFLVLFAGLFVVIAFDMRAQSKRYYGDR